MLTTEESKIQYDPNGLTTVFAFPYRFLDDAHIYVILTDADGVDVPKVITTDYTLTGEGGDSGGEVTMLEAPASGTRLTIYRDVPYTQLVDYIANDSFPAETHEEALDRLTMEVQQLNEKIGRQVGFPITEIPSMDPELPNADGRANGIFTFASDGSIAILNSATFIAAITPASGSLSVTGPAGNATTKSVTVSASNGGYWRLKVWIIDGSNSTPTLEETLTPPDGSNATNWDVITDANGDVTIPLTHEGAASSWRLCIEGFGDIIMSAEIALGV